MMRVNSRGDPPRPIHRPVAFVIVVAASYTGGQCVFTSLAQPQRA
jgi:hypothetical protein